MCVVYDKIYSYSVHVFCHIRLILVREAGKKKWIIDFFYFFSYFDLQVHLKNEKEIKWGFGGGMLHE